MPVYRQDPDGSWVSNHPDISGRDFGCSTKITGWLFTRMTSEATQFVATAHASKDCLLESSVGNVNPMAICTGAPSQRIM